jgi:hypothetical protein
LTTCLTKKPSTVSQQTAFQKQHLNVQYSRMTKTAKAARVYVNMKQPILEIHFDAPLWVSLVVSIDHLQTIADKQWKL